MRHIGSVFLIFVAFVEESTSSCFDIRSETMPRVTLQTVRNCVSADDAMTACSELPKCKATLFSASEAICLLFGGYYSSSTVMCTAPYRIYLKGACGCTIAMDDGTTSTINVIASMLGYSAVAQGGRKATSVTVPPSCEFALSKSASPNPYDMLEVMIANGSVTATTTGAATSLYGRCRCATYRICYTAINGLLIDTINRNSNVNGFAKGTDVGGRTIDYAIVPDGCTLRLADDSAGTNAVTHPTGPIIPGSTSWYAVCYCPP